MAKTLCSQGWGPGSITGQEIQSHILQLKTLCAATMKKGVRDEKSNRKGSVATGQPGSSCQGCLLCDELTLLQSRGLCGLCHSLRSCILNSYWSNHELVFPELAAPLEDALMRC